MRLIYLAGPYESTPQDSHAHVINYFWREADNLCLFSPFLHGTAVATYYSFNIWAQRNFFMIKKSSAVWVLTLPGWRESYGVTQELEYANSIQREVLYLLPETNGYVLTDARPVYTPTPNN